MAERESPDLVPSKDVHRTLHALWKPVLNPLGFQRIGGSAAYRREADGRWQTLGVLIDKYGWQAWAGGCFTVEFAWYDSPDRFGAPQPFTRWPALVTDQDLAVVRARQESIRDDKPLVRATGEELTLARFWEAAWNEQACLDAPYRQTMDIWLRYRRADAIEAWGAFFAERLPQMLDDFDQSWSVQRAGEAWPWWRKAREAQRRRDVAFAQLGMTKSLENVSEQLRRFGEHDLADWALSLDAATLDLIWMGLEHPDPEHWRRQVAERAQVVLEGAPRALRHPER